MIFVHFLISLILGKLFGNYFFFILGAVLPDLDHIYIIIKNKLFSFKKIKETIKYEEKFGIRYKTALFHSILGLILFSFIIYLFKDTKVIYFAISYLLHLLIDWMDIDKKYFLYPLKIKFKGFLSIWSNFEKMLTIILIIIVTRIHL